MNEKLKMFNRVCLITTIVLFIIFIVFAFLAPSKTITKNVDCYDRYGSKILNMTCQQTSQGQLEEQYTLSVELIGISLAAFFCAALISWVVLILRGEQL